MKATLLASSVLAALAVSFPVMAGKTYQVTGPILDITDSAIVIQKGKEKWEIAKAGNTTVKGDLQKGGKATVEYTMSATTIEVKPAKAK
ncbi:hypothetical protein [Methyloterricola oryzae]|uniref:hypothetical protein n=1 Tax=Methyloterricola oryzae TaxID=1495050 RepID=UPI0005EB285D|nr:hypothetical protein [Methyloterricola oryzae]